MSREAKRPLFRDGGSRTYLNKALVSQIVHSFIGSHSNIIEFELSHSSTTNLLSWEAFYAETLKEIRPCP